MKITCLDCGKPYPSNGAPFRCPDCGGLYDITGWTLGKEDPSAPGIWRWRESFGLGQAAPVVSLGEGNTPIIWIEAFGGQVAVKNEGQNPSGSYKDRGAAVLVSFLRSRGVKEAVEDSSGNAGAAFAAYAARAGLKVQIYVPASTSGPKRQQIETYGAELVRISGTRQDTADAVRRAAEAGAVYGSHASMPFVLPGYATIAYEISSQMAKLPATIIAPVGAGGMLLGIGRGFTALLRAGVIAHPPMLVGVQAAACAPYLSPDGIVHGPGETLAEGVRVFSPVRRKAVIEIIQESGGFICGVEEPAILPAQGELARRGIYIEPTSALVWAALEEVMERLPKPILLVLTGSGLKYAAPVDTD